MLQNRKTRILLIALVSLAAVSLAVIFGLHKTITLKVDGQTRQVSTYAFKVSDLLALQNVAISPLDKITPAPDTWLKNGTAISLVRAIPVQIFVDGKFNSIISAERLPSSLLEQAGVQFGKSDSLLSNGKPVNPQQSFAEGCASISLQLVRAVSFTLIENGKKQQLSSTAATLGSALWSAGISMYANDRLSPLANTPLNAGLTVTLVRSRPVIVTTQSGEFSFRTAAQTVGEALEDAHLSLQGLDYSLPSADKPIPASSKINLVRVTEQVLIEQTPLPFETEFQPVSDLELDSQNILQPGEAGITAQRVRVRYENGVEASRKVEDEWVARQPTNRIIGYGTALVMHTTMVDGVPIQYWRMLTMYATSYHPSEVGDTTASGLPLKKGVAAIDTSVVPFFTKMYIPGYGEAIAADIGGGVIGRWIDLGYSDSDYVPWHSWVTVYFLWPPPDNIVWIIP